jgi:uncharacterized membrane protein SirB2
MSSAKNYSVRVLIVSIIAGIIYNSWPLGYWLNPAVSKSSLASGLEAYNQPYNWLFISGDIISSFLMFFVCFSIWRRYNMHKSKRFLEIILSSVVLFGVGTIVDAMLPERCVPNFQVCPSFTQDHLLLLHGIFDLIASVFLFVCLCAVWLRQRHNPLIDGLVVGYVVFGAISLIQAIAPGNNGNWSQHYYLTLCSVWLAILPYAVGRALENKVED